VRNLLLLWFEPEYEKAFYCELVDRPELLTNANESAKLARTRGRVSVPKHLLSCPLGVLFKGPWSCSRLFSAPLPVRGIRVLFVLLRALDWDRLSRFRKDGKNGYSPRPTASL